MCLFALPVNLRHSKIVGKSPSKEYKPSAVPRYDMSAKNLVHTGDQFVNFIVLVKSCCNLSHPECSRCDNASNLKNIFHQFI